jgi:hypothetical protein
MFPFKRAKHLYENTCCRRVCGREMQGFRRLTDSAFGLPNIKNSPNINTDQSTLIKQGLAA